MVGWLCAVRPGIHAAVSTYTTPVNCGPSTLAVGCWIGSCFSTTPGPRHLPFQPSAAHSFPQHLFFFDIGDAISRLDFSSPFAKGITDALSKAKPPPLFKSHHRETQTASPFGPPTS